jgi:HD-GYP domain-containing protein (c-di-GMP phosphodiesterase class II)
MDLNDELEASYHSSLDDWSLALEAGQVDNSSHTGRVVRLALALAKKLNLSAQQTVDLRRGMLVHDIGVMAIPDSILFKPGNYSPEEFEAVKQHVRYGYDMLWPMRSSTGTLDIVRYHHERWDGSGYLDGLRGEQIPFLARLAAVIEVWDGTTSERPNRPAWSFAQARQYLLEQAGKQFDPDVVAPFVALLDEGQVPKENPV